MFFPAVVANRRVSAFKNAILDIERLLADECILCLGGQSNLSIDGIVRKDKYW